MKSTADHEEATISTNGKYKAIGQDVYESVEEIVNLTAEDLEPFKDGIHERARKRARLCAHRSLDDRLHEMFVVYVKETYVHPNKHVGKDESLHILEGAADFVFFDDEGEVTDVVPLGSYGSGRQFYCRIPESVYHTWVIHSDVIVVHETTPGPFDRSDTIFAPWAPEEDDPEAAGYMERLAERTAGFVSASG